MTFAFFLGSLRCVWHHQWVPGATEARLPPASQPHVTPHRCTVTLWDRHRHARWRHLRTYWCQGGFNVLNYIIFNKLDLIFRFRKLWVSSWNKINVKHVKSGSQSLLTDYRLRGQNRIRLQGQYALWTKENINRLIDCRLKCEKVMTHVKCLFKSNFNKIIMYPSISTKGMFIMYTWRGVINFTLRTDYRNTMARII